MRTNQALASWRAGQQTIGAWLSTANAYSAELLANAGFDWICVDLQHGLLDYSDLLPMLMAISTTETTPFVRVVENNPGEIMKVLDAGAMGVIVPMVNSRDEASLAVSACKYSPDGIRSFGPTRAGLYGGRGYALEANDEIACVVMVETAEALENLEEIVTTPGLAGVFIGPADLAVNLGLPPTGNTDDPVHVAAVQRVLDCCRSHGVPAGIYAHGVEYGLKRLDMGFDFVSLNNDTGFMMQAVTSDLVEVRQLTSKKTGS